LKTQNRIHKRHIAHFNALPTMAVKAPGRINLIGEHTDYNEGFVLPAAIDKAIYFTFGKREDPKLKIFAVDFEEEIEMADINHFEISATPQWPKHLLGIIKELRELGHAFDCGLNVCFGGDIPAGAGLSSSAAIEAGFGFGLNQLFDLKLSLLDLALVAQKTEHHYVGVKCGIMDMFASLFAKENQVIELDCRSLEHRYFPLTLSHHQLVLINSGVKHKLAESAYNKRRQECETGVAILKQKTPDLISLRTASLENLAEQKEEMPIEVYNRCRYVIEENKRVQQATLMLENQDLKSFGALMTQTHQGLSQLYEVSCNELDFLVETAINQPGVLGARMMGGGFGGCSINLVETKQIQHFVSEIKRQYKSQFQRQADCMLVKPSQGVSQINLS
jgi:galactokinase